MSRVMKDLLKSLKSLGVAPLGGEDSVVSNVTSDSREVVRGSVFVAVRGGSSDGHAFLKDVAAQGACLAVGEDNVTGLGIPYVRVRDSRFALAVLARDFYDNPSQKMVMVGVTGTSGKTTTTYLIESVLRAAGHHVGRIGTVNIAFGSKEYSSTHTTPGPVELQKILAEMKKDGCTAVVMEVSSHALRQKRAATIAFDAAVFTNLSPEHLDFHPDMEDYFQSKATLFKELIDYSRSQGKTPTGAINAQDEYGQRLISELRQRGPSPTFEVLEFAASDSLKSSAEGISGEVAGVPIRSKLVGDFNCFNIAAAVKTAQGLKISNSDIARGIEALAGVPGRLERVSNPLGIHVWVDYAHKPDALKKVLQTLNGIRGGHQLITVFGCGGDRDRKKRPVMGAIAVEESTRVMVTSDNPRTEDPGQIIREILSEIQGNSKLTVEPDRKKAIFTAISWAKAGDLVLIAGKGHEDYQILGHQKIHFDDREVAAEALLKRGH